MYIKVEKMIKSLALKLSQNNIYNKIENTGLFKSYCRHIEIDASNIFVIEK